MALQASTSILRFLVAEGEPQEASEKRRESVGRSIGKTYVKILGHLAAGAICHRIMPADVDCRLPDSESLPRYDALFLSCSSLPLYEETPEVKNSLAVMGALFASRTPSFGSCAGLQMATVAADGTVKIASERSRGALRTADRPNEAGRSHPLLGTLLPARVVQGHSTCVIRLSNQFQLAWL